MKKKKKLIIIWDVVFRDFDYYRLELEKISKFIDIEVHDMNRVFNKNLESIYQTNSKRKIVKRFNTFNQWKNNFKKINENNEISILLTNNGNNFTKSRDHRYAEIEVLVREKFVSKNFGL